VKPHSYTSEGIVLGRRDFGEADRILILYTKNFGRVSLIAKGVRRPKSRKRGHVEVFNLVKFQATAGHGLDMMTEAEVVDDFKEIRKSLKKVSLAYYFSEVVGRITHEQEPNLDLFNLIVRYLSDLKTATELKKLREGFIGELLVLMGYWPKGVKLDNPDEKLEEVIERQINSVRVGKMMLK
jgi:DNA repair protein RecO (recombination protein O)